MHFLNATADEMCGHEGPFSAEQFFSDPKGWDNTTWGLVAAFYDWLLDQGFAFTIAAHRLAAIKRYAFPSAQAGILDRAESHMISATMPRLKWSDRVG